jgi:hypothetical protein
MGTESQTARRIMAAIIMRGQRFFLLWPGIAAFILFANACHADGIPHCDGTRKRIPVDVSFQDIPISIGKHTLGSETSTLGSIVVTNKTSMAINEVDIQIEYSGSNHQVFGTLRFVASTGWPTGWPATSIPNWPRSAMPLAPGDSIPLDGQSLRIFAACPDKARLTAVRMRFSDGTEFTRAVSPWSFQELAHRIPRPQFPAGTIPQGNSAYLLQLSFSATGDLQEVRQLKPSLAALPQSVIDEFRKWRLALGSQPAKPEALRILAVLRVKNEGGDCDVYTCPVPFLAAELSPSFLLIDLVHSSETPPAPSGFENYDLYFGGIPAGLGGPDVSLGAL